MDQKKSVSKMRKGFDSAREKQKKKRLCMSLPPKYQNLFHNALSIRIMVIIAQLYLSLQSNWKDANAKPAGCNPATTPIVPNIPRKCTRSHCLNHMSDITDWNEFDPIPTIFLKFNKFLARVHSFICVGLEAQATAYPCGNNGVIKYLGFLPQKNTASEDTDYSDLNLFEEFKTKEPSNKPVRFFSMHLDSHTSKMGSFYVTD